MWAIALVWAECAQIVKGLAASHRALPDYAPKAGCAAAALTDDQQRPRQLSQ
jgi:hypothetical protein